jgi:tetratricopeptide (TPR) repeat protein
MRKTIFATAMLALFATAAGAQQVSPMDPQTLRAERFATSSADALRRFDYSLALRAAQDGLKLRPSDPWLLYDEGVALAGLGQTDESVATLRQSEDAFDRTDLYGRSVAAYRAGLALEMAGRCAEAKRHYEHYAALVQPRNRQFASDALRHAKACIPASERQNVSGRSSPARR